MTAPLDEMMAQLAGAATDRPLDALEREVSRAIGARRAEARAARAMAPWEAATLGLALAIGLTAGGALATIGVRPPAGEGPLAAATQLAPSTLLEGAG